jgi:hypothetical protein
MKSRHPTLPAAALACLAVACGDGRPFDPIDAPTPTHQLVATGRVHSLDGSPVAGLRVTIDGGETTTASIASDGSFSIQGPVSGDSASIIIDVAPGTARSTLPALIRVGSRSPASVRVVLVPSRWTVTAGSFAGTSVNISMDDAFRAPCADTANINCDGFFPRGWLQGVRLWRPDALPVRVAFDHTRTHGSISAADSVAFWNAVSAMNAAAGTPLFQPARGDEIGLLNSVTPVGGVSVRVDTTLVGFGAYANWWWNAQGDMYAGAIRTRTVAALRSGGLMTHELLHTQGFKHSCSWNTVMGGYGCGSTSGLSAADVAYVQLARQVHAAQRAHGAPHGLVAALQGERVVLRSLPPFAPAAASPLLLLRTDGIGEPISGGDHAH